MVGSVLFNTCFLILAFEGFFCLSFLRAKPIIKVRIPVKYLRFHLIWGVGGVETSPSNNQDTTCPDFHLQVVRFQYWRYR
uniref:Putative ovule protein n=1 Tax=Solanum chacoense TaxID=4108 RepID=A0A0V0GPU9_SOLCH